MDSDVKTGINCFILLLVILAPLSIVQAQTQTVRGEVRDIDSDYPVPGVHVVVVDSDPIIGFVTDFNGNYVLKKVPVGRVDLKFSFVGYKEIVLLNQLVDAGKELVVNVSLEEEILKIKGIVVTADRKHASINNDAVVVSAKTFDVQETKRYAGSRNDIARMASNYAGVSNANDARNDIIIKGNSPSGLLWRLEGIDIPNPNHFNSFGTTGGPVSMLNNNNLANSDFITAAFPAMYGNAISGVFDLKLRKGNGFRHEFMGQVGFNGFELGAEGPFSKKTNASYMANIRYSTLKVFQALGMDFGTGTAIPEYQDFTFSAVVPTKKAGSFRLFGIGGTSNIHFEPVTESDAKGSFYTTEDLKNETETTVLGINHVYYFTPNIYISTSVAASHQFSGVVIDSVQNNSPNENSDDIRQNQQEDKLSVHSSLNVKINSRNKFTTGVLIDYIRASYQDSLNLGNNNWFRYTDVDEGNWLTQFYGLYQFRFSGTFKFVGGLHFQHFSLNNSTAIEPRAGIYYQLTNASSVSLGYGLHSQIQPVIFYYAQFRDYPYETNLGLDMTKSRHLSLGFRHNFPSDINLKLETYYQYLFNIPIESFPSSYSAINSGADYSFEIRPNLVNKGFGKNYGLEMTLEKYFSKSYYFLISGTLFNSIYRASDQQWRNTAFNNKYIVNVLGGKEFKVGSSGVIAADIKFTMSGGRYTTPINLYASRDAGEAIYFEDLAFSQKYDNYSRTDFKIGFRLNNKKITHEWLVDIQNVFNVQNVFGEFYNSQTENIDTRYQLGIFIVPQYRILF